MKTFVTGLFIFCSFAGLSHEAPGVIHDHAHDRPSSDDKYKITLHVLSGGEDPSWFIPYQGFDDPARMNAIIMLLNIVGHGLEGKQLKKGGSLPDKNGYKGMTIVHYAPDGHEIHNFTIPYCYNNTLEYNLVRTAKSEVVSYAKKKHVTDVVVGCERDRIRKESMKQGETKATGAAKAGVNQDSAATNTVKETAPVNDTPKDTVPAPANNTPKETVPALANDTPKETVPASANSNQTPP